MITVAEAKEHLRIDDPDDAQLLEYIKAAELWIELQTNRKLVYGGSSIYLDRFPARITFPVVPVDSSGTISILYIKPDGFGSFLPDADFELGKAEPATLRPAHGKEWPATLAGRYNAVTVSFYAGYLAQPPVNTEFPPAIVQAVKLLVGDMYENREAAIPAKLSPVVADVLTLIEPWKVYIDGDENAPLGAYFGVA